VASDRRLTRAGPLDAYEHRRLVVGVEELALEALSQILNEQVFLFDGDRTQVAASIRQHWRRWKDKDPAERWYHTLADDAAKPLDWTVAGRELTRPATGGLVGATLADKHPSVSELLERRIAAAATMYEACDLALVYADWDHAPAMRVVVRLQAKAIAEGGPDSCIKHLAQLRASDGDLRGIDDYASWLAGTAPDPSGGATAYDFEPLWQNLTRPAVRRALAVLFADGSPWLATLHGLDRYNDLTELAAQPLLADPAFNRQVAAALADTRPTARLEMARRDRYVVVFPTGPRLEATVPAGARTTPAVGAGHPIRACDWLAYQLLDGHRDQAPAFELYWPENARDAAIAQLTQWVAAQRAAP
jgi:hypothetical protein